MNGMYAILISGYGKRRRYSIHELCRNGTNPTDGISYPTEELARKACESYGHDIIAVGDFYQILYAADQKRRTL